MVINTNVEAQRTANNLNVSQTNLAKSLSRLSSGSRIVNPSDDAAGLAVSSRLRAQIKRLDSALSNVINTVSFTQTQDGFMKTGDKAFRRMGELAMLARDETKSSQDRALYDQEFQQLKDYVFDSTSKEFNSVPLFDGKDIAVTIDSEGDTFDMTGIALLTAGQFKVALPLFEALPKHPANEAARLLCRFALGQPTRLTDADHEKAVSMAFVEWTRRLLERGHEEPVRKLTENLEAITATLPTAGQVLSEAALAS
jgi:flagellin-like hook-associated protein FlgL